MKTMKIMIISMQEPKRLKALCESLQLGTPIWIKGIDPKIVCKFELEKMVGNNFASYGPKGTICCAMSHLKAWKEFLKNDDKYGIVLEEDAIFVKGFKKRLSKVIKYVPKDVDIMYLGEFGGMTKNNFFTSIMHLFGNANKKHNLYINKYVQIPKVALGAHAYIISKKGAKKLISYLEGNVKFHIDYCIQELAAKGILNCYSLNKRIAYQTSTNQNLLNKTSLNIGSNRPLIISRILSNIYLDEMITASYIWSVSVGRIGDLVISTSMLVILSVGIILHKANAKWLLSIILLLLIEDFLQIQTINDISSISMYCFLFVTPALLLN